MRQRLPLVLSVTAVVVAVFGSTGVGQAARNAVGAVIPPFAKTSGYAKVAGNSALLNGRKSTLAGTPGTIPVLDKSGKLPASVGASGPKGDPGLSGVHVVQASRDVPSPSKSNSDEAATCPQGEVATGGSALAQQFGIEGNDNALFETVPVLGAKATANSYTFTAGPSLRARGHLTLTAYVYCAKAAS